MNDLTVFLGTRVKDSGVLAWIGDKGLAPFRYLCNGATVRIELSRGADAKVHHVRSFHKDGFCHWSASDKKWSASNHLRSSPKSMIRTIVAVILVIPGAVLAVSKLFAYASSEVRENHRLTKQHFTPRDIEIGKKKPVRTIKQLKAELEKAKVDPLNRPINALIIHGNGKLDIKEDPGILGFNPMKLILEGARIVHGPSAVGCLDEQMDGSKWKMEAFREIRSRKEVDRSLASPNRVQTVADALKFKAPRRDWTSCKRYHMVFQVAIPKKAKARKSA